MKNPLILASGSKARQDMMRNAGLDFEICPAEIDEGEIFNRESGSPEEKAQELARAKAKHVASSNKDAIVIGSDQILALDNEIFAKAPDKEAALQKLKSLRGKTHRLISAVSLVRAEEVIWETYETAHLHMHDLDDAFLENYCARAGNALTSCVGAYALESHGSWLFQRIEGDYFTVLGMPLLPLLTALRQEGFGL